MKPGRPAVYGMQRPLAAFRGQGSGCRDRGSIKSNAAGNGLEQGVPRVTEVLV